jgi:hypothetical protein
MTPVRLGVGRLEATSRSLRAVRGLAAAGRGRWLVERSALPVAFVVVVVGFYPGYMNADTLNQIAQARGGSPVDDRYAPLIDWLWKLFWPVGLRPGLVLGLQVAAFLVGSYLIFRSAMRPRAASIATALVAAFPPILGQLGLVGRDTWFGVTLVLGFGLIALAGRAGDRTARWPLILAGVALSFALASRQNAAPAVLSAAALGALILLRPQLARRKTLARAGLAVLAGGAATIAGTAIITVAVRAIDPLRVHPDQYVYAYDLGLISVSENQMLLPEEIYPSQDLDAIRDTITYENMIPMVAGPAPPLRMPLRSDQVSELRSAWWDEVRSDPGAYVDQRWNAWARQISLIGPPHIVSHPGIDPNFFGEEIEFVKANDVVDGYLDLFEDDAHNGGLLQRPWVYLLLSLALLAFLRGRASTASHLAVAMVASAWLYQVGLFFGASAVQYRYEFPAVTLAVLAGVLTIGIVRTSARDELPAPRPGA